tara:strand:+ start:54 stop:227 length:174 start_codon:yes stop_codon:yes gene_type:complete
MFSRIQKMLYPQKIMLGRWNLKHNPNLCEKYVQNYYAEPGYPNNFKKYWKMYQKSKN